MVLAMNGPDPTQPAALLSTIRKAKDEEHERAIWQTTLAASFGRTGNVNMAIVDANKAVDSFRVYFGIKAS